MEEVEEVVVEPPRRPHPRPPEAVEVEVVVVEVEEVVVVVEPPRRPRPPQAEAVAELPRRPVEGRPRPPGPLSPRRRWCVRGGSAMTTAAFMKPTLSLWPNGA